MEPQGDIALIGLAVMGRNLILNMNDHGYTVVAHNRTTARVDEFLAGEANGTNVIGARSIPEMIAHLKRPRRVMLLVKAGQPVDDFIEKLLPHLAPGDIIIDGGNSLYEDTIRRTKYLESRGFLFVGTGVSGGEEGARIGPSIMPGGSQAAWPHVKEIFQAISAKVEDNTPCCDWVGADGAGHYVKMIHNGIEYGMMQAYAEGFELMLAKEQFGLDPAQIAEVWRHGSVVRSWLLDLTAIALEEDPRLDALEPWVEDSGEGRWTVEESIELAVPLPVISIALQARFRSRQENPFGFKLLAAMRNQFGGHAVRSRT
jgi:6-phosphogluconate dehydrogenase